MSTPDTRFGVYDIEAADWSTFVVAATWAEGDTAPVFHTSAGALYAYLLEHPIRRWYAHNGGNYDVGFLRRALVADGAAWTLQGGRVLKATLPTLDLRDSVKLLPASLAEVGRSLKLPKLEADYDDVRDTPEIRTYLARDCEILLTALCRMRVYLDQQTLPGSIGGWGIRRVRAYGQPDIPVWLNEAFRPAVFGGRTEVIIRYLDAPPVHGIDIHSSYTESAAHGIPGRYLGAGRVGRGSMRLYRGTVRVPACHLPPLPHRANGRLYFPVGSWQTWVTEPEMEILHAAGGDMSIEEVHSFAPCDASARFAREHWALRQNATGFERLLEKSILNHTWGKLAEHPRRCVVRPGPPPADDPRRMAFWKPLVGWQTEGLYEVEVAKAKPALAHVVAGAWITAHARARLWRGMAGGVGEPAYVDTDSIFAGYEPAVRIGDELGEWGRVVTGVAAIFVAPKMYVIEKEPSRASRMIRAIARAKGFSDLGRPITAEAILHTLMRGETVSVRRIRKFREAARSGELDMGVITTEKRIRLAGQAVEKRRFAPDGTSEPWDVSEIHEGHEVRARREALAFGVNSSGQSILTWLRKRGGIKIDGPYRGELARAREGNPRMRGVLKVRGRGLDWSTATADLEEAGYPVQHDEIDSLLAALEGAC